MPQKSRRLVRSRNSYFFMQVVKSFSAKAVQDHPVKMERLDSGDGNGGRKGKYSCRVWFCQRLQKEKETHLTVSFHFPSSHKLRTALRLEFRLT